MLFCEAVRDGPGFVAALEKASAAQQTDHRHQGRPFRRRHPRQCLPHRVSVRIPHRLSRDLRTLRRHRSRGRRRSGRHRRPGTDLPAAERPSHRHHHRLRRRRRLDGRHAVRARPHRPQPVGGIPGNPAPPDAVLRRVRKSGGCHGPGIQHRAGDDDGPGTSRRLRRDRHDRPDHLPRQRNPSLVRCRAGAGGGGEVRQADDGLELHDTLEVRPNRRGRLRPVHR